MVGAVERVRPKMMTVIAIMAGLVPILWSTGTGSEVIQRIAVPMIGGMISSTVFYPDRHPGGLCVDQGARPPKGDRGRNRQQDSGEQPVRSSKGEARQRCITQGCGIAEHEAKETVAMMRDIMDPGMMWGMGLFGLLLVI